jgi:hypothetical protein
MTIPRFILCLRLTYYAGYCGGKGILSKEGCWCGLWVRSILSGWQSRPSGRITILFLSCFFWILTVDRKHIISLCSAITNTVLVSWHVTVMLLSMMGSHWLAGVFQVLKSELFYEYLICILISCQWTLYQFFCSVHHLMPYDVTCTRKSLWGFSVWNFVQNFQSFFRSIWHVINYN